MSINEESLHIQRLRKGDSTSFQYLYNAWSGKLYHFVMRVSNGDRYLAEEVVQSAFSNVWESRQRLNPDKSFGAYLCTIAKNQLVNIFQHRMLEYTYQQQRSPIEPSENSTEEELDYHLLEEYIDTLIAQLPPARREVFVLSRRSLLTNREIAEKLGLSENTVESQLSKAIAFMRQHISHRYGGTVPFLLFLFVD